jgi:hypothetical protein
MSYQKMFVFDPEDLVRLLTHYTDGDVPLDAEVRNVGFSPLLQRAVGIEISSKEFEDGWKPLHIRYEGKKILSWTSGDGETRDAWGKPPEAPKRQ